MKPHALVPALALAAALLAPPLADAGQRHRSDRGHRRTYPHGYHYKAPRAYGHGHYRYRPYSRGYRYYAPRVPYGYYGYYDYYPPAPYGYYPPPYYYYRPRSGVYLNFGFRF